MEPRKESSEEVCHTCGGLGWITQPALQRGDSIQEPDDYPCPDCSDKDEYNEDE
jgi:DNA-directed RNA polymerase subunit RPC12/RpoP